MIRICFDDTGIHKDIIRDCLFLLIDLLPELSPDLFQMDFLVNYYITLMALLYHKNQYEKLLIIIIL
ncbi:hypothetical protein RJ53_01635 [Methanocalculus chunghsingensis]|uniref:Uncharacterized protein n=1 Tax=Methanocalculus chunghsingensis TaxID=156457 RepID=A0A8J7W4S1_9EURY|nr:hypothetical protein [Methanocalculus chunghsingensis]